MASIKPFLRNNTLYILYSHKGKKYKFSSGIEIKPEWWNEKRGVLKLNCPYYDEINGQISKYIESIERCKRLIEAKGQQPYPKAVKSLYNYKNKESNIDLLWRFYEEQKFKKSLAESTAKRYRVQINSIVDFGIENKELRSEILDEYYYHCVNKFSSDNSVGKAVYFLKHFLNWCRDKHLIDFEPKYQLKRKPSTIVTLNQSEFKKFCEISVPKRFEDAKDIFIICATTGLSITDYYRLRKNPHWIKNDIIANPGRSKTGTPQQIPLNSLSQSVIRKYRTTEGIVLPYKVSQVINRNLKKICKLAEINEPITIKKYLNGKAKYETYPKWQLMSIHKARKTFATLGLQKGIDPFAIKEIGGWKDWKSMKPYIDQVEKSYLKEQMKKWS